jgi:hypothetical protein
MKTAVVCLVVSILTVLLAEPVNAQTPKLRAYVPFEFSAGRALLPAGEYDLDTSMRGGVVRLSSADTGGDVMISAHRAWQRPATQAAGVLVFHRYGRAYFLSQVVDGPSCSLYLIPKTKGEQAVGASPQVAREDVVVLAKH